jgi:hypothetical protein
MKSAHVFSFFISIAALAACAAVPPTGPDILVLPPAGKNLEQFSQDDGNCRVYAQRQMGGTGPQQEGDTQDRNRYRRGYRSWRRRGCTCQRRSRKCWSGCRDRCR